MNGKYQLTGYVTAEELARVTLAGASRWLERHGWTLAPTGAFRGAWYQLGDAEVFVSAGPGMLDHGIRTAQMLDEVGRAMDRQPWEVLAEMQAGSRALDLNAWVPMSDHVNGIMARVWQRYEGVPGSGVLAQQIKGHLEAAIRQDEECRAAFESHRVPLVFTVQLTPTIAFECVPFGGGE